MIQTITTLRVAAGSLVTFFATGQVLAANDLYLSEYVEGSGNNKAVEIFNATGATVDLGAQTYQLLFYFNGSAIPGLTIDLIGSIADTDVFVVANSSASAAILAVADQTAGGGWFNGDDAVALVRAGAPIDVIGQLGFDPGVEWGSGDTSTANNTLRRLLTVTDGDPNGANAFDPSVEWLGFQQDIVSGLGSYPDTVTGPVDATIFELQGAGHISPFDGQSVRTTGIVTAVDGNGFFLQDPVGDGDTDTADGIFVFTGGAPTVAVGDEAQVEASCTEFVPGGTATGNLSITELTGATVTTLSSGNALPAPAILGAAGRTPPTEVIDDDLLAVFDPASDAIDFYETFEGMLVTIDNAVAVAPRNRFNEIYTVVDDAVSATSLNARGGITVTDGDFNPERIQIQLDSDLVPGFVPDVLTGDTLGDVTGVVTYSFGNFEVKPTAAFAVSPAGLTAEITTLQGSAGQLTVATYNVLNLDPKVEDIGLVNGANDIDDDVGDGRFAAIAGTIVTNLGSPDIVALQEIQDNDGAELTGVVDASLTYQTLIDAIVLAGGPAYDFVDLPPVNLQDGGQPGGNIRNGYLYNGARVSLVPGSTQRIIDPDPGDGDAFENSRKPVVAAFEFNGERIDMVNMHSSSKGGSSPLFGQVQPPINGSEDRRTEQSQVVNDFVDGLLGANSNAYIAVLGDLNELDFLPPFAALAGQPTPVLENLSLLLPAEERYTLIFDGNSQALDHILLTPAHVGDAEYDIVHVNIEFLDQAADHEPALLRLAIGAIDSDGDGVSDDVDNCRLVANPTQLDTNGDDIGNHCDADVTNDCLVNFGDLVQLKAGFVPVNNPDADFTGDGFVNFGDLVFMKSTFFNSANPGPGPGAPGNACD